MSGNILNRLQVKTLNWLVGVALTLFPSLSFGQAELPFTMTEEAYNNSSIVVKKEASEVAWESGDNAVKLGDWTDGFSWKDKYIDIALKESPESISFQVQSKGAALIFSVTDAEWYVKESSDNTWGDEKIWVDNETHQDAWSKTFTIPLKPSTRYVRLCYSGNFGGFFKDINITPKKYSLKVISDGVALIDEMLKPNASIPNIEDPTKDCHTFIGWDKEIPSVMPESDLTITAQFSINQYTSHFKVSNEELGVTLEDYDKTFDCGAAVSVTDPSLKGYTFNGWEPEIPATATEIMDGATYEAKWTHNEHKLALYLTENDSIVKMLHYGEPTEITDPIREGYTFTGWNNPAPETMPDNNVTLRADWDINQYPLIINKGLDFDPPADTTTYNYNAAISVRTPSHEGYTFKGWNPEIPATMPADTFRTTAQWEVNQYRYVVYSSETDSTVDVLDYGTELEPLGTLMKPGYTFKGWDVEQPKTMPAKNLTIRAKWEINQYKINFTVDGVVYKTYTFKFNEPVVLDDLAEPKKEGHTFNGWDGEIATIMPAKDLSYEAKWITNQYSVVWINNPENDQMNDTRNYKYGEEIQVVVDPEREGYTFLGWDKEIPENMPAKNLVFTSLWETNSYTINFYSEEKLYLKQNYKYGETIDYESVTAPKRDGYTFLGWDINKPETMPAKNVDLNARWSINAHYIVTVTNTEDPASNDTVYYDFGEEIKPIEDPEKEGYSFIGWDVKIPETMPNNSLVITAKWSINNYTLTTLVNCVPTTYSYTFGDKVSIADPEIEGYKFNGWTPSVPETMPGHNVLVIADMEILQYDFITNIDDVLDTVKYDYSAPIETPESPAKEGYTFIGWYPEIPETMPAKEVQTKALWSVNSYKVNFISDGDTLQTTTYKYGEEIIRPKAPTKIGYTFVTWLDEMGAEVPAKMPASDLNFNAEWKLNSYYFVTIADDDILSKKYDYMEEIATPEIPTKKGYTFVEWNKEIPKTMPAQNDTVKALWKINSYVVTWVVDGDSSSAIYDYGEKIQKVKDPEKIGYTFAGWDKIIAETMPDGDLVYNAEFTVNQYKFFSNVDGTRDSVLYNYEEEIVLPENPTKTGHSFTGWLGNIPATMPAHDIEIFASFVKDTFEIKVMYEGDSLIYKYPYASEIQTIIAPAITGKKFEGWSEDLPATMPAENIVIEALYKAYQYQLTVIKDTKTDIEFYDFGEEVATPTEPTKEGYTFAGWDVEYPAVMPDSNVVVTALWTINQYDFTVVVDDSATTTAYDFNAVVEVPADPEKKGHTFLGWDNEIPAVMPSQNVTINAKFVVDTFSFTTIVLDEQKEVRYTFDAVVSTPAEPTREGYTFTGWSESIPTNMPDSNVTVTAEWAINQYSVAFVVDGETVQTDIYNYGDKVEEISVGDKEGYTFNGWDAEIPTEMPAENLVFNVVWKVNTHNFTYVTARNTFSISYSYGDSIIVPSDPTRKGFKFLGWSDTIPATMPDKDVKVNALWEAKKYAVTLVVDGVVRTDSIVYGDSLKIEDQKKVGYIFKGWDYEVPEVMPAKNFTLTAKFIASSKLIAWTEKQKLYVTGLPDDAEIIVLDVLGRMIYRGVKREIDLPTGGIYVVKGCNQYKKLMVK